MSWLFNCMNCDDDWEQRERNYIREMNKYKDSTKQLSEEKDAMAAQFTQEYVNWQAKEAEYMEQINDLHNQLHQSEVVMQQYKISEGNFQIDRQHFQDNQKQIDKYEKIVSTQGEHITNLKNENKKYLEAILDLTKAAIGGNEKREKIPHNGDVARLSESILV